MPKQVKESGEGTLPGNQKYDWSFLSNGKTYEMVKGEDFEADIEAFRTNCLAWARKHGYEATTRKIGDSKIQITLKKKKDKNANSGKPRGANKPDSSASSS